ncbi:MAG: hypothetical protein ACNA7Q_12695 [Rhodobacterales bacterium]
MTDATDTQDEVIATVSASAPRRMMGIIVLAVLGGMLVYAGLVQPPVNIFWQLILIAAGGVILFMAERMRRASVVTLELTRDVLRDSGGTVLVRVDQIDTVNRGVFAFKPSNGFVVVTRQPQPRHWSPGLWWRVGRRIGVGGVTPPAQTKFMAEMIQILLSERDTA